MGCSPRAGSGCGLFLAAAAALTALGIPTTPCAAQSRPAAAGEAAAAPVAAAAPPPYTVLRWDENYAYLRDATPTGDPFDPLKYIPLGGDAYLSLGGQARYRYEFFGDNNFGAGPQDDDGYAEGKFYLRSEDRRFLLHPWFHLQVRNNTNYREEAPGTGPSESDNGFELRRMKFGFDGNLFGPDLTYLFLWATDRFDGAPKLEEGWVKFKREDQPFGLRVGQIKNPFGHEQLVSSKYQLAVERSYITQVFANGDGFLQGITGIYDAGGPFRAEVGFTDGLRTANTNFQDFPATTSGNSPAADWGVAGRAEYKLFGNWRDYEHLTPQGNKSEVFVVGAGFDYTEAGSTGAFAHTIDAQYAMPNNLSFYAAYIGRYTRDNQGPPGTNGGSVTAPAGEDTYDFGMLAQVGYMIDARWEPFVRYDFTRFDSGSVAAGQTRDVHEITAGVNYYIQGHAAKVTLDATYLPNGSPISDTASGVLATEGDSAEFLFRAQFQLLL